MNKTIGICTMEKFDNRAVNTVGSSRIRARWLLPFWDEAEEYQIGKHYDTLIFQKVYWAKMMDVHEGVKILDICDPDWLENRPVFEFIDRVDAVVVPTEPLAEFIRKMRPNKTVWVIPDRVYMPEHYPRKEVHEGRAKKVVWFGYHSSFPYLLKTFDELVKRELEITVISDQAFSMPTGYPAMKVTNVPYSYPGIHKELIKHDMALLPVRDEDVRGKFKSNNKDLTCWALGLPVVKVPEDLDRFMTAEARNTEVATRQQEIKDKWDVSYSVEEYKRLVEELWKKRNV